MWFAVVALALALAADAAAVAAAIGTGGPGYGRAAVVFGTFQGGMLAIGALGGELVVRWASAWDHWVAFALLVGLGLRGIRAGARGDPPDGVDDTRALLVAALATSVDALASGVGVPAFGLGVAGPSLVVGAVTTACCLAGGAAGKRLGERFGGPAQVAAGVVLVALGVGVVVSHLRA
jgi:manganese efflux pump family protein